MSESPVILQHNAPGNPFRDLPVAPSRPAQFYARTWTMYAGLLLFGGLGCFLLIIGPLKYFGVLRNEGGSSNTNEGVIEVAGAMLFLGGAGWSWLDLQNRRIPMVQLYREGLKLRLVRWCYSSFQDVRCSEDEGYEFENLQSRELNILWGALRSATIEESGYLLLVCESMLPGSVELRVWFSQSDFGCTIESIAASINHYLGDMQLRRELQSAEEL